MQTESDEVTFDAFNDWWVAHGARMQSEEANKDVVQMMRETQSKLVHMEYAVANIHTGITEILARRRV
jgi:hypothetical protein